MGVGRVSLSNVVEIAFCTARPPLRVSTLTELRYSVWQPVGYRYQMGSVAGSYSIVCVDPWILVYPMPRGRSRAERMLFLVRNPWDSFRATKKTWSTRVTKTTFPLLRATLPPR